MNNWQARVIPEKQITPLHACQINGVHKGDMQMEPLSVNEFKSEEVTEAAKKFFIEEINNRLEAAHPYIVLGTHVVVNWGNTSMQGMWGKLADQIADMYRDKGWDVQNKTNWSGQAPFHEFGIQMTLRIPDHE